MLARFKAQISRARLAARVYSKLSQLAKFLTMAETLIFHWFEVIFHLILIIEGYRQG
jgi:hypothetical protein